MTTTEAQTKDKDTPKLKLGPLVPRAIALAAQMRVRQESELADAEKRKRQAEKEQDQRHLERLLALVTNTLPELLPDVEPALESGTYPAPVPSIAVGALLRPALYQREMTYGNESIVLMLPCPVCGALSWYAVLDLASVGAAVEWHDQQAWGASEQSACAVCQEKAMEEAHAAKLEAEASKPPPPPPPVVRAGMIQVAPGDWVDGRSVSRVHASDGNDATPSVVMVGGEASYSSYPADVLIDAIAEARRK